MADVVAPSKTVTFTVTKMPRQLAKQKTLLRLARLQPEVVKGLSKLQKQRAQVDNIRTIRAGRPWVNRAKATKLVRPEVGVEFTLFVTPQLMNDVKSIMPYVEARAAG
ncbi:MAG: hypothetical protein AB8G96_14250 [Phycisphaerales bacterium]